MSLSALFPPDIERKKWTQDQAISLINEIAPKTKEAGCHVALTGGCLYKEGERKDVDILFYRIRQVDDIDIEKLESILKDIGVNITDKYGFVYKAIYKNKPVDLFFPEFQESIYGDYDGEY